MKNKGLTKEQLNEQLKKFNRLLEYDYYLEADDNEENPYVDSDSEEQPQQEPNDAEDDIPLYGDETSDAPNDTDDIGGIDIGGDEVDMGNSDINLGGVSEPEVGSEDVEVDVTEIVNKTEEAKQSADVAKTNSELLIKKFEELQTKLSVVDRLTDKMDKMETELIKRNPTPVEKIEMRSLDSFPYNIKLSDFWEEKNEILDIDKEQKEEELTLTKDDILSDYSPTNIEKTFNPRHNKSF